VAGVDGDAELGLDESKAGWLVVMEGEFRSIVEFEEGGGDVAVFEVLCEDGAVVSDRFGDFIELSCGNCTAASEIIACHCALACLVTIEVDRLLSKIPICQNHF